MSGSSSLDPSSSNFTNIYSLFGVSQTANKNKGSLEATKKFATLSNYRDVLKDSKQRRKYDRDLDYYNQMKEAIAQSQATNGQRQSSTTGRSRHPAQSGFSSYNGPRTTREQDSSRHRDGRPQNSWREDPYSDTRGRDDTPYPHDRTRSDRSRDDPHRHHKHQEYSSHASETEGLNPTYIIRSETVEQHISLRNLKKWLPNLVNIADKYTQIVDLHGHGFEPSLLSEILKTASGGMRTSVAPPHLPFEDADFCYIMAVRKYLKMFQLACALGLSDECTHKIRLAYIEAWMHGLYGESPEYDNVYYKSAPHEVSRDKLALARWIYEHTSSVERYLRDPVLRMVQAEMTRHSHEVAFFETVPLQKTLRAVPELANELKTTKFRINAKLQCRNGHKMKLLDFVCRCGKFQCPKPDCKAIRDARWFCPVTNCGAAGDTISLN